MSAFLFKQTESDGALCARATRAFGRGESRASRTRTQAPARAVLAGSRQGGGKRGGAGRGRGLAGRPRGGVGDGMEDLEEGDFSQFLVEELAGAPDLLPLGLPLVGRTLTRKEGAYY